jgi:glutathione S-transferase
MAWCQLWYTMATESSLILYYIDDAFPEPLMPMTPPAGHRVRLYNKLIDEYVHNSCTIPRRSDLAF